MRLSAVLSALFHAAIFVAAMITISDPDRFSMDVPSNIPVELLTLDQFTNISAAITEEDIIEEPVDEEVAEEETPPEPEPQRVASLPEPEPVFEEVVPEFSPFEEPEPEVVEAEPAPAPPPAPDLANVRQRLRPEPPSRDVLGDLEEALRNIALEEEPDDFLGKLVIPGAQPEVADERRTRVGIGTGLTIGQKDLLRWEIGGCWSPPAGARNAETLLIELRITFNSDATVQNVEIVNQSRYRSDGYYRAAADAAKRAVERCVTGTNIDGTFRRGYSLPLETYEDWRIFDLTFDPSDML